MAASWTTITNGQVAAGAALTTSLVTALRDNPEGMAQRASGAPKIFGVPYDVQEFTSSPATWTKPTNAETGDIVIVEVVGGGQGGGSQYGGAGGAGTIITFDIDDVGATEAIVVGAGGAGGGASGTAGGNSSFGTADTFTWIEARGGSGTNATFEFGWTSASAEDATDDIRQHGGARSASFGAGTNANTQSHTIFGGGGGAGPSGSAGDPGGRSCYHGHGGDRATVGNFPGGGGGGELSVGGAAGAAGVVRVYCMKRD